MPRSEDDVGADLQIAAAVVRPHDQMLDPGAAGQRFFDAHFGVIMVNFIAEQLLHGIHDAWAAGDGAVKIFADFVPQNQFGRAALTVALEDEFT